MRELPGTPALYLARVLAPAISTSPLQLSKARAA
jgi:hypothetical protein